jgi:hypothetical protein
LIREIEPTRHTMSQKFKLDAFINSKSKGWNQFNMHGKKKALYISKVPHNLYLICRFQICKLQKTFNFQKVVVSYASIQ